MHGSCKPTPPASAKAVAGRPSVDQLYTTYRLGTRTVLNILAVGGELKSSVCLYSNREAKLSEPLGNLTDPQSYRLFVRTIEQLRQQFHFSPVLVAHDLHPLYLSTRSALTMGVPTVAIQHHHAHLVSVMADWDATEPLIGICCDGVGYGSDGAAWGCEVMRCSRASFERLGHLEYFPLPGADAAAIENWRPAAALLRQAFGSRWTHHLTDAFLRVGPKDLDRLARMIEGGLNAPMTSSLGRVFDGVSFLLGLCDRNDREAQAAIALEAAAATETTEAYPYEAVAVEGSVNMSLAPTIRAIVKDQREQKDSGYVSARFHETIAQMLAATAVKVCEMCGLHVVALSGGCFNNRRLLARLTELLDRRHLTILCPRRVPYSDACLALGQAVAAAAIHQGAESCV